MRVYVVGEVVAPGAYDISSLSTPLNALLAAGGMTTHGSLRTLKHYHGKQLGAKWIDAYAAARGVAEIRSGWKTATRCGCLPLDRK